MLITVVIWMVVLISAYIYGQSIFDLIRRVLYRENITVFDSIPLIILVGLVGINTFASFLSIFIKLGWLAQVIFLVIGIPLGIRLWRKKKFHFTINLSGVSKLLVVLALIIFLTILENGTHSPGNPDTGIYHAQAIRWIETYPAVPGLGNLHSRLAYDSNWLVLNAFFSFSFLGLRSFHVIPGAFSLVALVYFLGGTQKLLKGNVTFSNIAKTLLIPLTFYVLGSQISSPGTDLPAAIGIWIVFSLWLDLLERNNEQHVSQIAFEEILIFIFSIYLLTIKLSTIPVVIFAGYVMVARILNKDYKTFLGLLAIAFIILMPWFVRNLILSGYWIYPLPAVYSLSPNWDWKIPLSNVIEEQKSIQAWARIPGQDAAQVLAMPLWSWLKQWFFNLSRNQRILVSGAILSPIFYVALNITLLKANSNLKRFSFAYFVSYCGLAFWLYSAPDIRFGYGFIISTILLTGIPLVIWILARKFRNFAVLALISFLIFYQGYVLLASLDFKTLSARVVLPADYQTLGTNMCSISGYTIACAEYYNECNYDPFPCIPPANARKNVKLRGTTLRSGFRVINNSK